MRKGGQFPSITVYSNGTQSAVDLAVRCGYTLKWASFQVHLKFRRRVFSHCILKERNCPKNKLPVWPATEVFQPPASRLFFSSFHREARHTGTSTWAGNTIIIIILYHIISHHGIWICSVCKPFLHAINSKFIAINSYTKIQLFWWNVYCYNLSDTNN